MTFTIVEAQPGHIPIILNFIQQLAEYERLGNEVLADEALIAEHLFEKKSAYCCLAYADSTPVGFAIYFFTFSTFLGQPGLYLEDLFVPLAHRGKGYGKKLLLHLMHLAVQKKCGRMEWSVLDWNKPAIDFYERMGAKPMHDWTVYRLRAEQLKTLTASPK